MSPSLEELKRAIAISEEIESLKAELAAILSGAAPVAKARRGRKPASAAAEGAAPAPARRKRRVLSAEARERIAEAQRRRWAAQKGD